MVLDTGKSKTMVLRSAHQQRQKSSHIIEQRASHVRLEERVGGKRRGKERAYVGSKASCGAPLIHELMGLSTHGQSPQCHRVLEGTMRLQTMPHLVAAGRQLVRS